MLSYRHAFHAGGFADVLKHAVLVHVLRHAVGKPKPVYFLDTHAGAGSYDLGAAMAQKTGEYRTGIERLLAAGRPAPDLVALRPDTALVYASAAAVDKGVAEANGAHVERTEGTGCETTVYAVLEEVRITAAVGTLRTEDLGRVVEAGVGECREVREVVTP